MEQQQAKAGKDRHAHPFPATSEAALVPTVTLDMVTRLLEFSPDASLVVDAAGTIVLLNAQAKALFGYGQGELSGQPLEVLLPLEG